MKCKHKKCNTILEFPIEKREGQCIDCMNGWPVGEVTILEGDDIHVDNTSDIENPHTDIMAIKIPPRIYSEMKTYCDLAKGEISGLGKIKVVDGVATLVGIALLRQENTAANTVITEDTLTKFILALARKGQSPEMWKVWWHTHDTFGTFWSAVDESNISTMVKYMGGYLISVELNKAGSIIARIDEPQERFGIDLCIERYKGYKKLHTKCERRIQRMVTNPKFTPYAAHFGYGGYSI